MKKRDFFMFIYFIGIFVATILPILFNSINLFTAGIPLAISFLSLMIGAIVCGVSIDLPV